MDEPQGLLHFPQADALTIGLLAAPFVLALALIVIRAIWRRWSSKRRRLAREWDAIRNLFRERQIEGESAEYLEALVRRAAKHEPLRAVSTREGFETLVNRKMSARTKPHPMAFEDLGVKLRGLRRELGLDSVPIGHEIHSTRELHEGQWMSMALAAEAPPVWIRVMVEDVNEAYFYVMLKDAAGASVEPFVAGRRVQFMLWRDEDARYTFETELASFESVRPVWSLRHTAKLNRTQNRADYRIRYDELVVAGVLNGPLDGDARDPKSLHVVTRLTGRITSLSAGGCALVFSQPVARHVLLRVRFDLPGAPLIETELQIVFTAAISGARYLVRGRFLGLDDETRDRIARYVLLKQQQRLAVQSKD